MFHIQLPAAVPVQVLRPRDHNHGDSSTASRDDFPALTGAAADSTAEHAAVTGAPHRLSAAGRP